MDFSTRMFNFECEVTGFIEDAHEGLFTYLFIERFTYLFMYLSFCGCSFPVGLMVEKTLPAYEVPPPPK